MKTIDDLITEFELVNSLVEGPGPGNTRRNPILLESGSEHMDA